MHLRRAYADGRCSEASGMTFSRSLTSSSTAGL